jgi:hypothetical protein
MKGHEKNCFTHTFTFNESIFRQADVSFYMVCRNFDREKFALCGWEVRDSRGAEGH